MQISDRDAVDGQERRCDSPTSSADEEDALASVPAFWSQLGQKASQNITSPCACLIFKSQSVLKGMMAYGKCSMFQPCHVAGLHA